MLLVPGAWHGPQHLRLLIDELADLQVHTVALPSTGNAPNNWATVHQIDGVAAYTEHKTPEAFYNDVDPSLTEKAIAQLGYQSYAAPRQPLAEAPWKTVPSTYIICDADMALPTSVQEGFAKRANRIHRLNASHSPFLSQPDSLAQLIRQELEAA